MREQEMAVNVAKQIYFDEYNSFYLIAETKEDANAMDIIALNKLNAISNTQTKSLMKS